MQKDRGTNARLRLLAPKTKEQALLDTHVSLGQKGKRVAAPLSFSTAMLDTSGPATIFSDTLLIPEARRKASVHRSTPHAELWASDATQYNTVVLSTASTLTGWR